jgi:plasmid stabilization system protein ParE
MVYSVSIAEAAENDIREAFLWYEAQQENLGDLFEDFVSKALDSIRSNPLKAQVRHGDTRIFFLKKFPYGIHFRVDEIEKSILIVAVFHTSRDSKKWKVRG